jgi:hypothetical protein
MEIDAKHKVLYALYAEYQKDIPDMPAVTFEALEMDSRVYKIALLKLQNEGFIDGLETFPPHTRMEPKAVILDSVMPTRFGIEYVEEKLEISKSLTGREKLSRLQEKFGRFGWEVLQNVTSQILGNMIQRGLS